MLGTKGALICLLANQPAARLRLVFRTKTLGFVSNVPCWKWYLLFGVACLCWFVVVKDDIVRDWSENELHSYEEC